MREIVPPLCQALLRALPNTAALFTQLHNVVDYDFSGFDGNNNWAAAKATTSSAALGFRQCNVEICLNYSSNPMEKEEGASSSQTFF